MHYTTRTGITTQLTAYILEVCVLKSVQHTTQTCTQTLYFRLLILLTTFSVSEEEVKKLHTHFKSISNSIQSDGVIDIAEFQQALGLKNSAFAERIFRVFDINKDDVINFREFVCGLSGMCLCELFGLFLAPVVVCSDTNTFLALTTLYQFFVQKEQ